MGSEDTKSSTSMNAMVQTTPSINRVITHGSDHYNQGDKYIAEQVYETYGKVLVVFET